MVERAMITATVTASPHWKTFIHFCLQKKRPERKNFNTNSEKLQNHIEKQIISFKTTVYF